MLVHCLYASRPRPPLTHSVVDAILEQSRRNNRARGITGILCFTDEVFIQVLEGGRDPVSELFAEIAKDDRHSDVRLLLFDEIPERRFGSWTMGRVGIGKSNHALLLKYYEQADLDPFAAPAQATLSLLNEISDAGLIAGTGR